MFREHRTLDVLTQGAPADPNDPSSPMLEPQTYIITLLFKHDGQFDQEVRRLADDTFLHLGPVLGESFEELQAHTGTRRHQTMDVGGTHATSLDVVHTDGCCHQERVST
jgi:hypothetical protein